MITKQRFLKMIKDNKNVKENSLKSQHIKVFKRVLKEDTEVACLVEDVVSRTQGKMLLMMGGSGFWFRVVLK